MAGSVSRNDGGMLLTNAGSARFTTAGLDSADLREYVWLAATLIRAPPPRVPDGSSARALPCSMKNCPPSATFSTATPEFITKSK
jgi:hypothetical protein